MSAVRWRGISKLLEECGELIQVLAKLQAYPTGEHPDGKGPLVARVEDEMADVLAALTHFMRVNPLEEERINDRVDRKLARFGSWEMAGVVVPSERVGTGDCTHCSGCYGAHTPNCPVNDS